MPRRDDDLFDPHAIVPDTDDRATHSPRPRLSTPTRTSSPVEAASSLGRQTLLLLTLLGLIAACGLFHYQLTQQKELNTRLQTRLDTLESQLGVTSMTANQTSETLGDKLKALDGKLAKNNVEISKLWVANDKTSKSFDEQAKILATLQTSMTDTKKSVIEVTKIATDTAQAADTAHKELKDAQNTISGLQQRSAQGETLAREASQQAALSQEQSDRTQAKLDALEKRVADHDENLRSIDSFRRSVNTDLGKLKQERSLSSGVSPPLQ